MLGYIGGDLLYYGLGRLIFGPTFEKDDPSIPRWKRIVMFVVAAVAALACILALLWLFVFALNSLKASG